MREMRGSPLSHLFLPAFSSFYSLFHSSHRERLSSHCLYPSFAPSLPSYHFPPLVTVSLSSVPPNYSFRTVTMFHPRINNSKSLQGTWASHSIDHWWQGELFIQLPTLITGRISERMRLNSKMIMIWWMRMKKNTKGNQSSTIDSVLEG